MTKKSYPEFISETKVKMLKQVQHDKKCHPEFISGSLFKYYKNVSGKSLLHVLVKRFIVLQYCICIQCFFVILLMHQNDTEWVKLMNDLEKKMVNILSDLRENHHVIGIKAEFEAEGTRLEEALRLKEIVTKAGLELTIKIGGCEAIKDMFDAKVIGVGTIVAPMIETAYAMKKFVNAARFVFPPLDRKRL